MILRAVVMYIAIGNEQKGPLEPNTLNLITIQLEYYCSDPVTLSMFVYFLFVRSYPSFSPSLTVPFILHTI
jgi:hypothetical protein